MACFCERTGSPRDRVRQASEVAQSAAELVPMFRRRAQLAEVCRVLTQDVGGGDMWDRSGPTPAARVLFDDADETLQGTQRVMLQLAFWLWGEGGRGPSFGTAVELLDRPHLHRVGSLLIAMSDGAEAVDRWIRSNGGFVGDA